MSESKRRRPSRLMAPAGRPLPDAPRGVNTLAPVRTAADLDTLDDAEIVEGYLDFRPGDPEPGENRGRAYWHGWLNAARDRGHIPPDADADAMALVDDVLKNGGVLRAKGQTGPDKRRTASSKRRG